MAANKSQADCEDIFHLDQELDETEYSLVAQWEQEKIRLDMLKIRINSLESRISAIEDRLVKAIYPEIEANMQEAQQLDR